MQNTFEQLPLTVSEVHQCLHHTKCEKVAQAGTRGISNLYQNVGIC